MKRTRIVIIAFFCILGQVVKSQTEETKNASEFPMSSSVNTTMDTSPDIDALTQIANDNYNPGPIARLTSGTDANQTIKDINISTDKYTGIAHVQIPIYNIELGEKSLPIALSYNTSGIRANDLASVVGLGWRLSVGGKITRAVRGRPDNFKQLAENETTGAWSKVYFEKYYFEEWDTQRDLYYFELPSMSGSFVLDHSGIGYTIPYQNIKIEYKDNAFKIYDEQGTCYYMTTSDYTAEYYPDRPMVLYTSAWFLDRIEFLNGNSVNFQYKVGPHINYEEMQEVMGKSVRVVSDSYYDMQGISGSLRNIGPTIDIYRPHYLERVSYRDQQVDFIYREDENDVIKNILDTIKVAYIPKQGQAAIPVKTFVLNYGRFQHNRLKLSGIEEKPSNRLIRPICNFEYYEDVIPPERNKGGIDYWGYYNAAQVDHNPVYPYITLKSDIDNGCPSVPIGNASGTPDLRYSRVQSLKKITYPMGGSQEFVYELHKGINSAKSPLQEEFTGGLRIKQIIRKSSTLALPTVYSYTYEGGVIYDDKRNYILSQKKVLDKFSNTYQYEFYHSHKNLSPTVDFFGSPVVYSAVIEHLPNQSSVRYDYVPYEEFPDIEPKQYEVGITNRYIGPEKIGITPKANRSWGRNLLKKKTEFGSSGEIVSYTTYEYAIGGVDAEFIGHTMQDSFIDDGNPENRTYRVSSYLIQSVPVYLKKEIIHKGKYNLSSEKIYEYALGTDNRKRISKITTKSADGNNVTQEFKYPLDFDFTDSTSLLGILHARNVATPIEEITLKNNKIISAIGRSFRFNHMNGKAIVLDEELVLKDQAPIDKKDFIPVACTDSKMTFNSNYIIDTKYLHYNESGQLLCLQDRNDVYHSFIYRESTRPIAYVTNAIHSEDASNQVYFNDFETIGGPPISNAKSGKYTTWWTPGHTYTIDRKLTPGSYILSFWVNDGPPAYSKQTRLIKVENTNYQTVVFGITGQIDDVAILPPNATIRSCVHIPGWGNISETDERGRTIYTEYNEVGLPVKIMDNERTVRKIIGYN